MLRSVFLIFALLLSVPPARASAHDLVDQSKQGEAAASRAAKTYKGLEVSVSKIERVPNTILNDCPPGENNQRAMTKPGEEFALVTLSIKVLPGFQPGPLKRPTLRDQANNTYNTAVSFVDVGKVPQFSCGFPFRVPAGTKLKTLDLDTISFDLGEVP